MPATGDSISTVALSVSTSIIGSPLVTGSQGIASLWSDCAPGADDYASNVAGPLANFILAIAIFAAAFSLVGVPIVEPRVDKVVAGGAADRAGIKPGDVIVEVEGKAVENFSDLQEIIIARPGEAVYLIVDRGGSHVAITVVPELKEESDGFGGKVRLGRIGVEHNSSGDIRYKRLNPLAAVAKGAERSWYIVSTTFNYLGKLFTGRESADQLGLARLHLAGWFLFWPSLALALSSAWGYLRKG